MNSAQRGAILIEDDDNDDVEFFTYEGPQAQSKNQTTKSKPRLIPKISPSRSNLNERTETLMEHIDSPQVHSPFANASWTFEMASTTGSMHTGSPARPRVVEKRSQSRTLSTEPLRVFALSPSPMSRSSVTISKTGTSSAPIEFEENENEFLDKLVKPTRSLAATRYRNRDASYPLIPRGRRSERQAIISLDEDEDVTVESGLAGRRTDALARSMRRHPTKHDELIDLEDIESFEEIEEREIKELQRYDLEQQLLRVEDVYHEDHQTSRRRSSKAKAHVYRNPTIISPFYAVESYEYKNSTLKPKKTVELRDGDFLWIKHIILSRESNQVSLRGIRLQRVRDLNGMVEKKINEVCLFYEVDLDDSRKLEEQSAVEVPVADVVRIRILRTTNQTFPLCRNITLSDYRNKEEVAEEGGLTVRWKYTCTYATATDRHRNVYRERTLKHIRADEATEAFMITDNLRRHEWRGETIPGGAYQPAIKTKQICHMPEIRQLSHISIISDNSDPEICPVPTVHPRSPIRSESSHKSLTITASFPVKRKFSSSEDSIRLGKRDKSISGVRPKRIRYEDEKVESTRKRFSGIRLQIEKSDSRAVSVVIDLVSDEPTVSIPPSTPAMKSIKPSSLITPPESGSVRPISRPGRPPVILPSNNRDLTGQSPCPRPRLTMSLLSSELSNPPTTGSVQSNSAQTPTARSPGQTLTYGDAFCGAGGTTRGAAMAGLRVKWGFDFWEHACATWGANFPYATCYYLAAHQFVEVARQATRDEKQDIMKVDIVHLSPPCQYFSPAHTINGADDEMNIASLFAVQEVIEVARPRIVTLEQTFGIVSVRFRYYFAALIQMFTSHDFSVRWAIVPLAQWGLPQRRFRLIIIASCPGEILPRMPAPTHSDSDTDGLKPLVTVNRTLASIPHNAPDHNPDALTFTNRRLRSWDGNTILPRTMTTSGGQNYHPSGTRDFTLREYASLQGFPLNHVFRGTGVKKQIGNAVPPCVAKVLFESIKRDLDKADGIVEVRETVVIE